MYNSVYSCIPLSLINWRASCRARQRNTQYGVTLNTWPAQYYARANIGNQTRRQNYTIWYMYIYIIFLRVRNRLRKTCSQAVKGADVRRVYVYLLYYMNNVIKKALLASRRIADVWMKGLCSRTDIAVGCRHFISALLLLIKRPRRLAWLTSIFEFPLKYIFGVICFLYGLE